MGYDLHVIRGDDWTVASPIPIADWLNVIERQQDFRVVGSVEAATPDRSVLRYESEGLAEWVDHPSGQHVPFDFRAGQVVVKNPDQPTIKRMSEIAQLLGARVQGDDGEWYD